MNTKRRSTTRFLHCTTALLLAALMVLLSIAGCTAAPASFAHGESILPSGAPDGSETDSAEENASNEVVGDSADENSSEDGYEPTTWAIYWYLCGSDLETDGESATNDLLEMTGVTLPDNIKVIIQTGGANEWHNDYVDAEAMYRLEYGSNGLKVVESVPNASMGDPDTLAGFLEFCEENYEAERKMLIFWDHGGGSTSGVCFDELFDDDYLTLDEISGALDEVYGYLYEEESEDGIIAPFEMIGFDACLMGTVDAAAACADYAYYMTASEEFEPNCGWKYDAWLDALAKDPEMYTTQLGQIICDSYYEGCIEFGMDSFVTMSTIDLTEIGYVLEALDALSAEAVQSAAKLGASKFFAEYGRGARKADYYGERYHGMVDIVSLAIENEAMFPNAVKPVIESVQNCVVYQKNGSYRAQSYGLAAYYPFEYYEEDFNAYAENAASPGLTYLYELLFTHSLSEDAAAYFTEMEASPYEYEEDYGSEDEGDYEYEDGYEPGEEDYEEDYEYDYEYEYEFADASEYGLEDYPVSIVEEDGWTYARLELGTEASELLQYVAFALAAFEEDGTMTYLGEDSNVDADWEEGVFMDMFAGTWGAIDGHIVTTSVSSITDEYVLYEIPILYNSEECTLSVAYTPDDGTYEILTATPTGQSGGAASKIQYALTPGDEITPLFFTADLVADEAQGFIEGETIIVTDTTSYAEAELPDGLYGLVFTMRDYAGDTYMSDIASVVIEGGVPVFEDIE